MKKSHFFFLFILLFALVTNSYTDTNIILKAELSFQDSPSNILYFSPNYDGYLDDAVINLKIISSNAIEYWKLLIYDQDWKLVRQYKNERKKNTATNINSFLINILKDPLPLYVPESISWDGIGDSGSYLPEGKYYVFLKAVDIKKNESSSFTNQIILDVTPPSGSLSADDNIISPNGDGIKDTIIIHQDLSAGDFWKAEIRDIEGKTLTQWNWGINPPDHIEWNGKDSNGNVLPEGSYDYLLYGEDRAGNKSILSLNGINLTLKKYSLFLILSNNSFSPNGDGILDTLQIIPVLSETNGLISSVISIKDKNSNIVKEIKSEDGPDEFIWDGRDNENNPVKDGDYLCSFKADYDTGDSPISQEYPITVDKTPPKISIYYEPKKISPDGDGVDDVQSIHFSAIDPSGIKKWEITVYDPDGKPFKTFTGTGAPAGIIKWDGRSDNGELVESAHDYPVIIYAEDNLGNKIKAKAAEPIKVDVLVEKTARGLMIRINSIEFDSGKSSFKNSGLPVLTRVSEILRKYSRYRIEIDGHTDNIGSEKKNTELSIQRAKAVSDYLEKNGISRERMDIKGFGFKYPIKDNSSEEGRRKNRRVEFILIKS